MIHKTLPDWNALPVKTLPFASCLRFSINPVGISGMDTNLMCKTTNFYHWLMAFSSPQANAETPHTQLHSLTQNRQWDDRTSSREHELANAPKEERVHDQMTDEDDNQHTNNLQHLQGDYEETNDSQYATFLIARFQRLEVHTLLSMITYH